MDAPSRRLRPARSGRGIRSGDPRVSGTLLDPVVSEQTEPSPCGFQSYRHLELQKDDLRSATLLFIMVPLLVLLGLLAGLYLARR